MSFIYNLNILWQTIPKMPEFVFNGRNFKMNFTIIVTEQYLCYYHFIRHLTCCLMHKIYILYVRIKPKNLCHCNNWQSIDRNDVIIASI